LKQKRLADEMLWYKKVPDKVCQTKNSQVNHEIQVLQLPTKEKKQI
jgi:hypothetical protein